MRGRGAGRGIVCFVAVHKLRLLRIDRNQCIRLSTGRGKGGEEEGGEWERKERRGRGGEERRKKRKGRRKRIKRLKALYFCSVFYFICQPMLVIFPGS